MYMSNEFSNICKLFRFSENLCLRLHSYFYTVTWLTHPFYEKFKLDENSGKKTTENCKQGSVNNLLVYGSCDQICNLEYLAKFVSYALINV